jgi:hypothetical protein
MSEKGVLGMVKKMGGRGYFFTSFVINSKLQQILQNKNSFFINYVFNLILDRADFVEENSRCRLRRQFLTST